MGSYANYFEDLPVRCNEILKEFSYRAEEIEREVTLLLAVATPCIILPYERLHKKFHPSKDQKTFSEAKDALDTEMLKECRESSLWNKLDDWRFKKLDIIELPDGPWQWGLDVNTESITNKKAKFILCILRNALAHGNIYTLGDPIETIVFVSLEDWNKECNGPFNTIQCSPKVLGQFLKNWVNFLSESKIPADLCVETESFREKP